VGEIIAEIILSLALNGFVAFGVEYIFEQFLQLLRKSEILFFRLFDPLFQLDDQFDFIHDFHIRSFHRRG